MARVGVSFATLQQCGRKNPAPEDASSFGAVVWLSAPQSDLSWIGELYVASCCAAAVSHDMELSAGSQYDCVCRLARTSDASAMGTQAQRIGYH